MILTGSEIKKQYNSGNIIIEPYYEEFIDPNSYTVHLGSEILQYNEEIINAKSDSKFEKIEIPETGLILEPDKFYLGHTYERIGGLTYCSELYANLSLATCGMFIQTSAPLGHTGSVIQWTLEIIVANRLKVYPKMRIGKVCFWKNMGKINKYEGRYCKSKSVVHSKIWMDEEIK